MLTKKPFRKLDDKYRISLWVGDFMAINREMILQYDLSRG